MQTIITKFIPATDHKPARVKAKQQNDGHGQTVTVGWDDYWNSSRTTARSRDEVKQCSESVRPHALAALRLMKKIGFTGEMIAGGTDAAGMVWVFTDTTDRITNADLEEYRGYSNEV